MQTMKIEIKHCRQPLMVSSWITCYLAMMLMLMTLSTEVSGVTVLNLTEVTQQTTNDSVTVTYILDPSVDLHQANYSISISSSPQQIRYLTTPSGEVTFSGLLPGLQYNVRGSINGTVSSSIPISTKPNDPIILCIPTNTSLTVNVIVPQSALSQIHVACAPACTPPTNTSALTISQPRNFAYDATFTSLQYNNEYNINVTMRSQNGLTTSSAQVTCTTIEKAPEPVTSLMTKLVLPYAVTLEWQKPYRQNGIIRYYIVSYIEVQNPTDKGTYNTLTADTEYTVPNLTPGRNYNLSVSAFTVAASDPVSISVATPIGKPDINATSSPVSAIGDRSSDRVTVTLTNPFSDKNGPITGYTVVVSLTTNQLPADEQLDTWRKTQQSLTSQRPYAAVYQCEDLFSQGDSCWKQQSSRRRRETTQSQMVILTLGGDGQCPESSTVYCNGPLNPSTTYYVAIRAYSSAGYTDSAFSQPVTTGQTKINMNIIIGVVVGVGGAIIIAVIIIVVLVYMGVIGTRHSDFQPTLTDIYNMGDRPSHKIKNADFGLQFDKMSKNDNAGFHSEYQKVEGAGKEMEKSVGRSCAKKNRSPDVIPYDHSRVKLVGSEDEEAGLDYINASWIPGQSSLREYIATQVPVDNTVDDLWRMIWEHRVNFVILAALPRHDKQSNQLEHFLPSQSKQVRVGNMIVRFVRSTAASDWTTREFKLEVGEQSRDLRLLTFDAWTEENSQPPVESLAKFINHCRSQMPTWDGHPVVVLCSYGVGPTSVIIAMDRLIQQASKTKSVDVFGTVYDMRLHRMKMVDTENLYIFLYRATLFAIKNQFSSAHKPWGGHTNGNNA